MNDQPLPDIAAQATHHDLPLDWVGMAGIALPIRLADAAVTATADIGVSLDDAGARGIHMSRLYLAAQRLVHQELNVPAMLQVLDDCLSSHQELSDSATLSLRGEVPLKRPALVSPLHGWKTYPFELHARQDGRGVNIELQVEVAYSSTCPCSAALARQLIQQRFAETFATQPMDYLEVLDWLGSTQGIVATPHSQRSMATLRVRLAPGCVDLPLLAFIESAEQALGTPVQTAVKRADEQAFALANGQNLMFCEDAARRLHRALRQLPQASAFRLKVVHAESLHAHDAVAQSRWNWN
ncbi:GTP cyclohydrolase FolE2 [Pseudomonas berkeleyensis]|uniref:GTP cyclohydrolase FolE2 n=1 Tax=Pseudomonas berkeleyensis TaxID=2726956 RepID=A0A7G5DNN4_9PSED|nr:GTP cyclohydrolase FolE2 [Pseudomonas berkeleyensis]QMV63359.1 GTP cyclohydrolase I FolE2 [Pseudomonas berkeleyensis]WSO38818.1 GTP cyclohydrolase FolE2 [Pseudomonas berkeleyensis]